MFRRIQNLSQSQTQKSNNFGKDYVRTTDEQKLELIDLVINQRYSMKLAAEIVGVKLSTVKYIIKAYRNDKECFMTKIKPKKIKIEKEQNIQISKNQCHLSQEITSKDNAQSEPKLIEQNYEQNQVQSIHSFASISAQNFTPFQGYFQLFPQWDNFSPYNSGWILNYQGN